MPAQGYGCARQRDASGGAPLGSAAAVAGSASASRLVLDEQDRARRFGDALLPDAVEERAAETVSGAGAEHQQIRAGVLAGGDQAGCGIAVRDHGLDAHFAVARDRIHVMTD